MNIISWLRLSDEGVAYKNTSDILIKFLQHSPNLDDKERLVLVNHLQILHTYVTFLEVLISKEEQKKVAITEYYEDIDRAIKSGGYFSHKQVIDIITEVTCDIGEKIDEANTPNKELIKKAILKGMAKTLGKFNEFRRT